uniref:c-SKI SMAD4-binding domain-containing protein n=1 Tax=Lutzomyia longipalpis TaxID=7200 RepID=A0A1B0CLD1_LUTLO
METTAHLLKRPQASESPKSVTCNQIQAQTSTGQPKANQVSTVLLYGIPIVSLFIESQERLCLAQISNTLLKQFSYNEIHNRRVALGITCVQCTPVQLEILRRAGAMPVSSRRCGMITRREAERLCKSFLGDNSPPRLPDDFAFAVHHECAWGCRGSFLPARYNSSRAKCIKCAFCGLFFSPNKFIFHSHRLSSQDKYVQPDAANFNSWRRHMKLSGSPPEEITHAWEDVKAMFNGGTRKRLMPPPASSPTKRPKPSTPPPAQPQEVAPPFARSLMMDWQWPPKAPPFHLPSYALHGWLKRPSALLFHQATTAVPPPPKGLLCAAATSAFRPVAPPALKEPLSSDDEMVDIESTEDDEAPQLAPPAAQQVSLNAKFI